MTADTITAIKKALMELPLMKVEFSESSSEGNSIISPTDDFEDVYFTVIGCGDKQDDLGKLIALSVNSMPGLLSTLESLQRENEKLRIQASNYAADAETVRRERDAADARESKLREALRAVVESGVILGANEVVSKQSVDDARAALSSTGDPHGN